MELGNGIIYSLNCPINGDIRYIGQTKQLNYKSRYYQHIYQWKRCNKLSHLNAWIKHLSEKNLLPIFKIIESNIKLEDLNKKEKYYINFYKNLEINLVNTTEGGEQDYKYFSQKEDWKIKRLKTLKTSIMWKERNKRHSKIIIQKHKDPNCKIGFENMSKEKLDSFKEKSIKGRFKKVCSINNNGDLIEKFDSIKEAAKFYNIKDSTHIVKVCKGKSKSGKTHGIIFKYDLDIAKQNSKNRTKK